MKRSQLEPAERLLDLLADLLAPRVAARLGAQVTAKRVRLRHAGLTARQLPTLRREGVDVAKVGKYWMVDVASLDAYSARQRALRPRSLLELDPTAGVDAGVAAAFRRAARSHSVNASKAGR
jgi:hypothetical protein